MGKHNWEKIETIIDEVLQLPEDERKTYIEEKCGDDKNLKGEVTELLQSIFDSEGWLENPKSYKRDLYDEISNDNDIDHLKVNESLIGKKIGSYTIREKIGEGGMGYVYMAERTDDEFDHQVAIKIIREGHHSSQENLRRFKREQRILAGMNHPGIAHLFDGGVTDDGFPYIIMEYVDGVSITEYCRKNHCSLEEKISLFYRVLEAVRYAHENLVIHRDLKPGNILVNDSGEIKILDFGISKLLEEEDTSLITQTGKRLLTVRYAAPEQIKQTNITTASDLYSLGTLFYELLAGNSPFNLEDKTRYECERIILEEIPPKPSSLASTTQLKNELAGDLDAIVLKSIRKEPEHRYRVANEFLEDLRNYEKGLPVAAREDTLQYRSKKFLNRHKQGVAVTAGIVLLIIGFASFYTWNIAQERNLAEREAERAEEVTEFMVNLFQSNNPEESLGEEMPVSAVLDQGIERIENTDLSQINRAIILGTIAQIKIKLGDYDTAEKLLSQAMIIVKDSLRIQNKNSASVATINGQLASILGDFDESEKSFLIADSLFKSNSLTQTSDYRDLKFNMVNFYQSATEYDKSLHILNEMSPNQFGDDSNAKESKSAYYNYKAIALKNLGRFDEAIENYLLAIELRKEIFGPENPETATAMNNLANVYVQLEQLDKALEFSKNAHEIRNEVFGPNHYLTGSTLHTLSSISRSLGNFGQALDYAKKSITANKNSLGENHIRYALTLRNTGNILRLMGRYNEAEQYLDQASNIVEENYSDNHTFKGYVNMAYAELYNDMEKYEIANKYYSISIDQSASGRGKNHPSIGEALTSYAKMEIKRGNFEKAEELLKQALSNLRLNYDTSDKKISEVESLLADIESY